MIALTNLNFRRSFAFVKSSDFEYSIRALHIVHGSIRNARPSILTGHVHPLSLPMNVAPNCKSWFDTSRDAYGVRQGLLRRITFKYERIKNKT